MFKINKVKKFKLLGITYADSALKKDIPFEHFFDKFREEEIKDFLDWYLKYANCSNTYLFYHLIAALNYRKITYEDLDELLTSSNYVKTMTTDLSLEILEEYSRFLCFLPKFTDLILSNIDSDDPKLLVKLYDERVVAYSMLDKIADYLVGHPIYDIIVPQGFKFGDIEKMFVNKVAESKKYSLEEMKKFLIESDVLIDLIVDSFGNYFENENEDAVIDHLMDAAFIYLSKESHCQKIFHLGKLKSLGYYASFVNSIKINIRYTDQIKEKIAEKIFASKNINLMLAWISLIEINKNKEMIDYLVNSSTINAVKVLTCVTDGYFIYALSTICEKGFDFVNEILNIILENINNYPIIKVDNILVMVLEKYPEFKFGKDNAVLLIKAGSIYANFLLHNYPMTKEERLAMIDFYRNNGREDLLALYSSYLISGDTTKLLQITSVDIDLSILKREPKDVK